MNNTSILGRIALIVVAAIVLVWSGLPILWLLLTSFKSGPDIRSDEPVFLFTPTLTNYANLFSGGNNVGTYLSNSLIVTGTSTVIAVALGAAAGYGLTHWRSQRKPGLSMWIISTRMAPIPAVILPLFLMFRTAGLVNTLPGLILAHLTFNLPFAIWLMTAFFQKVPHSIEEAAFMDGASKFRTFWSISLPTVIPGVVTTAVLCAVFSWNDYAFSSALGGPGSQTLPMTAGALVTQTGIDWGLLSALAVIVATPMLIAGLSVRRYLVTGLSLGAVTGE
ncbi:MAG: carbohydrate ABC transporter permease [Propioniciclava sp.]